MRLSGIPMPRCELPSGKAVDRMRLDAPLSPNEAAERVPYAVDQLGVKQRGCCANDNKS